MRIILIGRQHPTRCQEKVASAGVTPEQQMQLLDAWGPPARGSNNIRTRELQAQDWLEWLRSCAWRYEARPHEPSADELHRLLIRWAQS